MDLTRDQLGECKGELADTRATLDRYREKDRQFGRWRIKLCGQSNEPLNLTVCVQYVRSEDRELAVDISKLFVTVAAESPWNSFGVENVLSTDNPSYSARIVLFSDHPNSGGVVAAMKDCRLVEGKIARQRVEHDQDYDVLIVIYDHVKEED